MPPRKSASSRPSASKGTHDFLYGSTDIEIDELESDGPDEDAAPSKTYLGDALRKEWAKDIPPHLRARWGAGPPGLAKQRAKEAAIRERAKLRKQKQRENQKASTRGGRKAPARQPAQARAKSTAYVPSDDEVLDFPSSDEDGADVEHPHKRARTEPPTPPTPPTPRKYTAYINVERPPDPSQQPIAALRRFTGKVAPAVGAPIVEQHGPIILQDNGSFETFLTGISGAVGCIPSYLPVSDLYWRFEKPSNNSRKPLRCAQGYAAMLSALGERVKDRVVVLQIPPPKRPSSQVPGLSDELRAPGYATQSEHPYEDNVANDNPSVREQMVGMSRQNEPSLKLLEARYPMNNFAHVFPGKRVYQRAEHHWELNSARLSIWAHALARNENGVTTEMPPNSIHFAPKAAMRLPAGASVAAPEAQSHVPYGMTNTFYPPSGMPYPHPGPSFSGAGAGYFAPMHAMSPYGMPVFPPHYSAMMHSQAMQAHPMNPFMPPTGPGTLPYNTASRAQPPPINLLPARRSFAPLPPDARPEGPIPTSTNSAVTAANSADSTGRVVSASDFCAIYGLSDEIASMLEMLKLSPGDRDLENTPFDRLQLAGFSFADWEAVVTANRSLIYDLTGM
ncbi:hypothetical protein VTO73DRAFT_6568 [Trametes versicolor]